MSLQHRKTMIIVFITSLAFTAGAVNHTEPNITQENMSSLDMGDSEFNISTGESYLFEYINNNPVNRNHSSQNWMIEQISNSSEDTTEEENKGSEDRTSEGQEGEYDSSDGGDTETIIRTRSSWSTFTASVSTKSAHPNQTVYINGKVTGDKERAVEVFLGDEKISETQPINGSFKIPVKAGEIEERELTVRTGNNKNSFNVEVSPETKIGEITVDEVVPGKITNFCVNLTSEEAVNLTAYHNNIMIGGKEASDRTCFETTSNIGMNRYKIIGETPDGMKTREMAETITSVNTEESISDNNEITGSFGLDSINLTAITDIEHRIESLQQEIDQMLEDFISPSSEN